MTTLMRWSPFFSGTRKLDRWGTDFDRLFDGLVFSPGGQVARFSPATDIQETPEAFIVRLDLPGVAQGDVKVSLLGDELTISGERKQDEARKEGRLEYRERVFGSFQRGFTLSAPVQADQVKATFKDGVLEVHVPKAPQARSREIEIQVG
ncbi:MAG TPA: Hsp20/alpha crystallin family protein [Candidatus Sulfotelmatobacter sp.]|nr:Hsp20/alpha crystallin family protein [Candidatus Sulfotelmatobacter sp.]